MSIRFPVVPAWVLSVLVLTVVCLGCARRNVVFESSRDLMPCREYGGKVSLAVRAEPVAANQQAAPTLGEGIPPASSASEPVFTSDPLPRMQPSTEPVPVYGPPIFFAPPGVEPLQATSVTQTGFSQSASTDNTIFASYPGPLPPDPAYSESPPVDLPAPVFGSPGLSVDSLDISEPAGGIGSRCRRLGGHLGEMCFEARENVRSDHRNYYDCETMSKLACSLVIGSVLANTSMDEDVHNWYQEDVRWTGTDRFAEFWKTFGDGKIFIPSYACLAVACKFLEDRPVFNLTGEFSARTTRAYLVGAPPLLFMQFMLGASRPDETDHGSHWDPFQDTNSVSGHAFVGAVPFLAAADMTDNVVVKGGLYACSTFTGLSRINDDDHYLSQVILGWWMAYLACEAVDQTQLQSRGISLMPIASTEMVGFGAICEY